MIITCTLHSASTSFSLVWANSSSKPRFCFCSISFSSSTCSSTWVRFPSESLWPFAIACRQKSYYRNNKLQFLFSNQIKCSLYSLNTLSGVTSERCPSPRLCARAHTSKVEAMASRWQRMGNLIGSGYELLTSRTRSEPQI